MTTAVVCNTVIDSGDIAFVAVASAFVMLQTPAMRLAQAGSIRRKNALSILVQICIGQQRYRIERYHSHITHLTTCF